MPTLVLSKLPVCRDLLLVAAVPVGWRGDAAAPAAMGRLRRTYATASPTEQRWWEPCRADEALSYGETSFQPSSHALTVPFRARYWSPGSCLCQHPLICCGKNWQGELKQLKLVV